MPTGPDPILPPLLLAVLARLTFVATTRDPSGTPLGVPTDGTSSFPFLLVACDAPGSVAWALSPTSTPPRGFAPHVMTRETFDVLAEGTLDADGAVLHQGRRYRVALFFDGVNLQALAHPA